MSETEGPLPLYRQKLAEGLIRHDPMQALAAEKLEGLWHRLKHYHPQPPRAQQGGLLRSLFQRRQEAPAGLRVSDTPQGLYLYGGVGRGKSMLMDLFFSTVPLEKKRRVHFNAFMLECHARLHEWRTAKRDGKLPTNAGDDPIRPLARRIADEAWVLCFDEFHVTDIADAMILGRLFLALDECGVVIVATSNWPPDDLYKDGLQRDLFVPFIGWLKRRFDVLHLDSPNDYRLGRMEGRPVYFHPLGPQTDAALEEWFDLLTHGLTPVPEVLAVGTRTLAVPRSAGDTGWFTFEALCTEALGAADYLVIAARYRNVILAGVPKLSSQQNNETKRLQLLIDSLYENRVRLIIGADTPPEQIYAEGRLAFEFERTVSRLIEMQAEDYLKSEILLDQK